MSRDILKKATNHSSVLSKRPSLKGRFSFKLRWEHVVIAFLLGLLMVRGGGSTHIVRAQMKGFSPAPAIITLKTLPLLKEPPIKPQIALETVYVSPLRPYGTYSSTYDPGQCTWYTASRLPVPDNWGNAINWGYAAAAAGYTISDTPKPGAIAWSVSDSYLGHVAVVEDDGVTISEMNFNGPYSMDSRIPNPGEFRYIYL